MRTIAWITAVFVAAPAQIPLLAQGAPVEWPAYGRDAEGTRYSPAAQITRENVGQLKQAWSIRTGDLMAGSNAGRFEAVPIFVDGTLFLSTPLGNVLALDPETGAER